MSTSPSAMYRSPWRCCGPLEEISANSPDGVFKRICCAGESAANKNSNARTNEERNMGRRAELGKGIFTQLVSLKRVENSLACAPRKLYRRRERCKSKPLNGNKCRRFLPRC